MKNKSINKYNCLTVYYANTLARMCSKFSLEEEKIIHLIFSQIKPYEKNDSLLKLFKLDFFNKLDLKSEDKYTRYANILEGLINKSFVKLKDENDNHLKGYVISASRWNFKEPYFEVEISRMFMPFIEQLVRDYTKVNLDSVLKLKSKHSLSLYKFLCSWTDENKITNQRYVTTKELKELFGLSIDDYVYNGKFNRGDFERYTIKRAVKEINDKSNIFVKNKKNKIGNKIQNYEFSWTQKEKYNADNYSKETTNKRQSLNDKHTQLLLDNIDSN